MPPVTHWTDPFVVDGALDSFDQDWRQMMPPTTHRTKPFLVQATRDSSDEAAPVRIAD
jgi:hypothetical protein